jgi:hypothetical protein
MQGVRIDRLYGRCAGLIFQRMKNRELTYPTPEQLYALEQAARAARSREIARLASRGIAAVKNFAQRFEPKGMRHA